MKEKSNHSNRFDNAAETWDESPRRLAMAAKVCAAIEESVGIDPSWNMLDVGCGTGLVTLPFAKKALHITALDTSAGMLEVLEKKAAAEQLSNITTLCGELGSLVSDHRCRAGFDCIISSMTLHHIDNTSEALAMLAGLLKNDGTLAFADLDSEDGYFHDNAEEEVHHGFDRAELASLLASAGLSNVSFRTAAEITKVNRIGKERTYSIFLCTARKNPTSSNT
ncbi:class I SAM-dependent DNA methyltransferase [Prosthecochloris sp. CIB 2401]|uniref:class I SAM-dependent DNA methyltransferase n=1 Tax=Prosthecochloris sp. CIB 2401 TaxID=1868325 RepID=UPI00080AAD65|nr:class I SAM-dependent methyltransferase [Prosthecochloris sp. CIB 2401]ANT64802.1 Malonyl-CoA O-methyltransferase BioC [Prosthecochloris sp. CIB 2401]